MSVFIMKMSSTIKFNERNEMFRIGDFSKLARISIRMLRFYDEKQLLVPAYTDPETRYRYYQSEQLGRAMKINELRSVGFGTSAIREILEASPGDSTMRAVLKIRESELTESVHTVEKQLSDVRKLLEQLDSKAMEYEVKLKTFPKWNAASLRKIIPAYDSEVLLWGEMMQETGPLGLIPPAGSVPVTVFYDPDYKEADPDIEIRRAVDRLDRDTEHVKFMRSRKQKPSALSFTAATISSQPLTRRLQTGYRQKILKCPVPVSPVIWYQREIRKILKNR